MKPELRIRFFAQYLNTCDCGEHGEEFQLPWDSSALHSLIEAEQEDAFLSLRPLSDLTDEEAIEVAKIAGELVFMSPHKMYWKVERDKRMITIREKYHTSYVVIDIEDGQILIYEENSEISAQTNTLWSQDYLRSIGIALPYCGHSVESLVESGWIKLVEHQLT